MLVYVIEKSSVASSNDFTSDLKPANNAAFKVHHLNGNQLLITPEDKKIRYSPLWTKDNWNMESIKHYYGIGQGFMLDGTIPKICETTTGVKIELNPHSVTANRPRRGYSSGAARSGYGAASSPSIDRASSTNGMDISEEDTPRKNSGKRHGNGRDLPDMPEAKKRER